MSDDEKTHMTPCLAHLTKTAELHTTELLGDSGGVHNDKMTALGHVGHLCAVVFALVDDIDVEPNVAVQEGDLDGGVGVGRQRRRVEDGPVKDQDAIAAGAVGRLDRGDGPDLLILAGGGMGRDQNFGVGTPAPIDAIGNDEAADGTMIAGEA